MFNILIVDDSKVMRLIIRKNLEKLGQNELSEADNGKSALEILEKFHTEGNPIKLVICDWSMPEMSGIELLTHVRKTDALKNTLFIMVSAEKDPALKNQADQLGVSAYLTKPFKEADFKNFITDELKKIN